MDNPSLVNNQAEVDISSWKVSVVAALGILSAALFGFFLSRNDAVYSAIFGVLFLMSFVLQTFFIKSGNIGGIIVIAESLALAIPFFIVNFSFLMLGAWLFTLIFLFWGNIRGKRELSNQLKIMFFRVERPVTSKVLTAVAILASIFYAGSFSNGDGEMIKKVLNLSLRSSVPLIQKTVFKDFSLNMTVNKFLESLAMNQLGDKLKILPADQRKVVLGQAFNDLKMKAADYGVNFQKNDTISNVVNNYVLGLVKKIPVQSSDYFVLAISVLIFIFLRSFGFLIRWIVVGPLYLIFQVLMVFGFARISLESRSREIILLD